MSSGGGTQGPAEEKQPLGMIATLCRPKPQGGNMLLPAAAVSYSTPKSFLGPSGPRIMLLGK